MTTTRSGERFWTRVTTSALLLGLVHASVDAASGYLIFRDAYTAPLPRESLVHLALLYNGLAFGTQALLGYLADRGRRYGGLAVSGLVLVGAALAFAPWAVVPSVVAVGLGNALFHVGAGALVLDASGHRSAEAGVFVGPGALGLATGVLLGLHRVPARGVLVALLIAGALALPRLVQLGARRTSDPSGRVGSTSRVPGPDPGPASSRLGGALGLAAVTAILLLASSVTIRALVGDAVGGRWRGVSTAVVVGLAVAACGGKMLGGFVGDRLGFTTVSVGALAVAAPLVSVLVGSPAGAILGMLVFQMTMPMTLKATHELLPGRPGLAFGIPCVALLVGALPGLLRALPTLRISGPTAPHVLGYVLASAVLVGTGLALARRVGAASPAE